MAEIKQDLLSLQYSQNFDIQGLQEANVDLQLPPAPTTLATVYGVVTDGTAPITDATVKLFDSTGMPYQHTLTDATGGFTPHRYSGWHLQSGRCQRWISSQRCGRHYADQRRHFRSKSDLYSGCNSVAGGYCRRSDGVHLLRWQALKSPFRQQTARRQQSPIRPLTVSLLFMIWRTAHTR